MNNPSVWSLIYTKPRQELEAQKQLERQGYTTYLPMLCRRERHGSRLQDTLTPLFPRYLFIRLTAGIDDWGPIRSTRGVSNMVRFGIEAARVPDNLIEEIRTHAGEDGYHHEEALEFKQGDRVHIADGPFSGCAAIFQASRSEERVLILLDVVGQATRVEVQAESLEKRD
jgi:transcriptional antiterminator RfaH